MQNCSLERTVETREAIGDDRRYRKLKIGFILLIGVAGGILTGLMGIGGGILLVPAMVLLLGFDQHKAHGTSLAVMLPKVIASLLPYWQKGNVNLPIAAELALGGVVGAVGGAKLANSLSSSKLRRLFGLLLLLIAVGMLYDGFCVFIGVHPATLATSKTIADTGGATLVIIGMGIVAGALSGLLGVGGGFVMVPAMVFLLHMDQKMAQGISLLVIIPVAISGATIHFAKGNVDIRDGKWLAAGGIVGGAIGGQLACQCSDELLRLIFGGFVLLTAWLTLRKR